MGRVHAPSQPPAGAGVRARHPLPGPRSSGRERKGPRHTNGGEAGPLSAARGTSRRLVRMCDLSAHREAVGVSCAVVTKALQRGCNDGAQVPKAMQRTCKGTATKAQNTRQGPSKGGAVAAHNNKSHAQVAKATQRACKARTQPLNFRRRSYSGSGNNFRCRSYQRR